MLRRAALFLAPLIVLLAGNRGSAEFVLFANLTNAQENPSISVGTPPIIQTVPPTILTTSTGDPRPASFGTATFILNDAMTSLRFNAVVFNIDFTGTQTADVNDNLVAAHIHAAAVLPAGTNAPVVWGFFGNPFNDNNPNDVVVTPFATGVGGTVSGKWDLPEGNNTTLALQLPNILAGRAYINFHTVQFGGGEIRGQIVPEPSSVILLGLGSAALLGLGRRWARVR
jgi:hypothetical protein